MKVEGDHLIFSTGKRLNANCGIIGLGPDMWPSEGYDGGFHEDDITPEELVEMADYMIEQWKAFRAVYAPDTAEGTP